MTFFFLMSCNENHDFSLDENRQLLIVHNFLHLEIESDCLDPSEYHLFFITKKNEFDTKSCDTMVLSLKVCKYSFYSLSFHSFFIFSSFHFLN